MRTVNAAIAVCALGYICLGLLADEPTTQPADHGLHGKIVRVDGGNVVVSVRPKGEQVQEVTVKTDDKTAVRVDGKVAAMGDLKAEMILYARLTGETATRITAWSKPPTTQPTE